MPLQHWSPRTSLAAVAAACLLAGCPDESSWTPSHGDGGVPDGARPVDDAGAARTIPWPEPTSIIEGGLNPAFAQAPDGRLMLAYRKEDKAWIQNDPPQGTAAELGTSSGYGAGELRLVASPIVDRAFAVWTDGQAAFLSGGVPDGPATYLYAGMGSVHSLAPGWVDGRPYVVLRTGEVWVGSDRYPPLQLGFQVPLDSPGALPMPEASQGQALQVLATGYHHYGEAEKLLDLGQGRAFTFLNGWEQNESDPADSRHYARWWVLHRAPSGNWLAVLRTGQLELPGTAVAWIQPHALGDGRHAVTWGGLTNSLVYDVFVAGLALSEDGTPSLTTAPVNVSMTFGDTDNSDHPVLASAGDGRTWIAWREPSFGPRVALLGPDLRVVALGAPPSELECHQGSAISGVADADGTFHLAAATGSDSLRLLYWRFPRP